MGYKSYHLQRGDTMSTVPMEGVGRSGNQHSLNRLQLEFDQFVIGAIRWLLMADKLVCNIKFLW